MLSLILVAPAAAAKTSELEVVARGPTVGTSIGMSRAGYTLMFDLGVATSGIRSFANRRLLLSWDVLVAARAGELANAEPYLRFVGARALSSIEPAYRTSDEAWSPVVSARLAGEGLVLWNPGTPLTELHTRNDVDGAGGLFARGLVRGGFGASYLDDMRSLLLQLFVQEQLQGPGVNADAKTFTQVGASARYDVASGWTALLELAYGVAPTKEDSALGRTDRTTRMGVSWRARKIFRNGMWLGLVGGIQRDTDRIVYTASGTEFRTGDPADFSLGLFFGMSLWRSR